MHMLLATYGLGALIWSLMCLSSIQMDCKDLGFPDTFPKMHLHIEKGGRLAEKTNLNQFIAVWILYEQWRISQMR